MHHCSEFHGTGASFSALQRSNARSSGLATSLFALLATPALAQGLPTGSEVVSGSATIASDGTTMTIDQTSQRLITNWQDFSIGAERGVVFKQPGIDAVALNRVIGQNPSQILGSLSANGQVFLINPNGIVFGQGGEVQTGGFIASTLGMGEADFLAGDYRFAGTGGTITSNGDLTAPVVALIAPSIRNDGTITGDTALAAGTGVRLDFDGDGLLSVEVEASTMATLVENNGLIHSDGGTAVLTAKGASDALKGVVNNSGTIEANALGERNGRILLLGDMENGEVGAGGRLAASFVETSAADVSLQTDLVVNTEGGEWLIDPVDIEIDAAKAAAIEMALTSGDVTVSTADSAPNGWGPNGIGADAGNISVNASINWSDNLFTLRADGSIAINAELFGSATAGLALEYGQRAATAGNDAGYAINAPVNLASTGSFSTKLGSDGATVSYTIITDLGTADSSGDGTLQGIRGNLSGNYVLGADIEATATAGWNPDGEGGFFGFAPLGQNFPSFNGTFDGLGHEISDLYIRRPGTNGVALFGYTRQGAVLRNFGVVEADIAGSNYVGAALGQVITQSTLHGLWSSGTIVATSGDAGGLIGGMSLYEDTTVVRQSRSSALVSGTWNIGGLLGSIYANQTSDLMLEHLQATGRATATGGYGGGLIGQVTSYGTATVAIEDAYSTAAVDGGTGYQGGLVGQAYAHGGTLGIQNSYAAGSVSGSSYTQAGMVGYFSAYTGEARVSDSFWDADATGRPGFGGYVDTQVDGLGLIDTSGATALDSEQAKDPFTFIDAGWDFGSVWGKSTLGENNGYMMLRGQGGTLHAGYLRFVAGDLQRTYGATNPAFDHLVAIAGDVTLDWAPGMTGSTDVGTYGLGDSDTLVATSSGGIYSDMDAAGNLVIAKAPLTVTALDDRKTYDGLAYSGGNGVSITGLVNNETDAVLGGNVSFGGDSQGATNAGTYAIDPTGFTSTNYEITLVGGTLTIDKASLLITAEDLSLTYDGTVFSGPGRLSYGGFVNGETNDVLTGTAIFAGSAIGQRNAGQYDISVSGLDSENYEIVYAPGLVTINPATITAIDGILARDKTYDGLTGASLDLTGAAFDGMVSGDDLVLDDATGSFSDPNPGMGKVVTINGFVLNGGDSSNYELATDLSSTATANITSAVPPASPILPPPRRSFLSLIEAIFAGFAPPDALLERNNMSADDSAAGCTSRLSLASDASCTDQ